MADKLLFSSSVFESQSPLSMLSQDSEIYSQDEVNAVENTASLRGKLKLAWFGDYSSLKRFVHENIDIEGNWSSPGGERKAFSDGKTTITWWKNKKHLQMSGSEADVIKQRFCSTLINGVGNNKVAAKENVSSTNHSDSNYQASCRCNCRELVADLEGMKLEMVINERNLKVEAERNKQATENLWGQLNLIQKEVSKQQDKSEGTCVRGVSTTVENNRASQDENIGELRSNFEAQKVRANAFEEKYASLLFAFNKLKSKQDRNDNKGTMHEDQPFDLQVNLEVNNRKYSLSSTQDDAVSTSYPIIEDTSDSFDIQLSEYRCKHKNYHTMQVPANIIPNKSRDQDIIEITDDETSTSNELKDYRDKQDENYRKAQLLKEKNTKVLINGLSNGTIEFPSRSKQRKPKKQ